jgi:hypothetical protein
VIYRNCMRVVGFLSLSLVWGWGQAALSQALPQTRIVTEVKNEQRLAVEGTTPTFVALSAETGRLPSADSKKPHSSTIVVTATSGTGSAAMTRSTPLTITLGNNN